MSVDLDRDQRQYDHLPIDIDDDRVQGESGGIQVVLVPDVLADLEAIGGGMEDVVG